MGTNIPASAELLVQPAKFGTDYTSHDMPDEGHDMRMVVNRGADPLAIVVGGIVVQLLMPKGTYPMSDPPYGPEYKVVKLLFPKEEDWAK